MKRIVLINICLYLLLITCEVSAQEDFNLLITEWAYEKEWDVPTMENVYEELAVFLDEPLNLNTVMKEQLELFPFLTDGQIENILAYLYITGDMNTLYELHLIEGMDLETIRCLLLFVTVKPSGRRVTLPGIKELVTRGRGELTSRFDWPFYSRKGIKNSWEDLYADEDNKYYLGSKWYSDMRYSYRYRNTIHMGVTAQKDAGEPFFRKGNKQGYDFYSFYFLLQDINRIKTLALGNYRLNFGQGLVMNTDFSMGKNASVSSVDNRARGIKKHASTGEFDFFQGGAICLGTDQLNLSLFYSNRRWDGIVNDSTITSIKKDGIHRIYRDFERRNVIRQQCMGSNVTWHYDQFRLGLTGIYYFFNRSYQPVDKPYSRYALRGRSFFNIGADYRYIHPFFTVNGEIAMCRNRSLASVTKIKVNLFSDCRLVLLHRYYSFRYINLYSRSISEGSSVQNETGYYIGLEMVPVKNLKLFVYGDYFIFPWLKYGVDTPSSGYDVLLNSVYTFKKLSMGIKYRYKQKEQNFTDSKKVKTVVPNYQHQLSLNSGYRLWKIPFKTQVDYKHFRVAPESGNRGIIFTQQISFLFKKYALRSDMQYSWFNTGNYATRIYRYEKGLLNSFSNPSFYGKGSRYTVNLRYDRNKWMFLVKFGSTVYRDREEIGSGLETIENNCKSDLQMQVRIKI